VDILLIASNIFFFLCFAHVCEMFFVCMEISAGY